MHENLYTYAQLTLFFIDIWLRPYCIMSAYRETAPPTIRCHIHAHLCRCVSVESHNIAMINAIIVSSTVWLWSQTSKKIIAQTAQDFNENKHHKMLCTLIVRQLQLRGCCINEVCSQLGEKRPILLKCIIWKFRKVNYICIEFERSHPYEMNLSIARLAPSPSHVDTIFVRMHQVSFCSFTFVSLYRYRVLPITLAPSWRRGRRRKNKTKNLSQMRTMMNGCEERRKLKCSGAHTHIHLLRCCANLFG